jgi:Regulator of ribonuclease activity B
MATETPPAAQRIEFHLRFPSQLAATHAAQQLIDLAFATRIEAGANNTERVISAVKVMRPVESDLMGLADKLNAIAAAGRGAYEGWNVAAADPRLGYWIEERISATYPQAVGLHMAYDDLGSGITRIKLGANFTPANLQTVDTRCDGSQHPIVSGTGQLVGRIYSCRITGPRAVEALITRANTNPLIATTLIEAISVDGNTMTGTWTDRDPAGKVVAEGQRRFSRRR